MSRSELIHEMNGVLVAVKKLDQWIQENGWSGYDPGDLLGTPVILSVLKSNSFARILRPLFLESVKLFPWALRTFFRVKKDINAKAMALLARGYFNLYRHLKEDTYLEKASACLSWLEENYCRGYSGYCWGYPFDWQSSEGVLFPRGTPSGVVSSIVGHAFLDGFDILKEEGHLKVAESVCSFISNDLNRSVSENKICFSYTPLDDYEVHNVNLWCASLLARVAFNGKQLFEKLATKAVQFTLDEQRDDGAWYYWSTKYANRKCIANELTIDNYHTGFLIECLMNCKAYIPSLNIEENIKRGGEFYVKNFVLNGGIPALLPNRIYPIDIHGCAQTIITLTKLSEMSRENLDAAKKVAIWTIRNMQDVDGFFYYRVYRWRVNRIAYIRWAEAWMLKALSDLLLQTEDLT